MPPRLPQAARCEERRGFRRDMTLPTRPITAFVRRKVPSPHTHVPVAPVLHLATGFPCRGATAAGGRGGQRVAGSDFQSEKIAGRGMKATAQGACQFSSLLRLFSFYFGRPLGTRPCCTAERAQWAARRPHTVRCCFMKRGRQSRPFLTSNAPFAHFPGLPLPRSVEGDAMDRVHGHLVRYGKYTRSRTTLKDRCTMTVASPPSTHTRLSCSQLAP